MFRRYDIKIYEPNEREPKVVHYCKKKIIGTVHLHSDFMNIGGYHLSRETNADQIARLLKQLGIKDL